MERSTLPEPPLASVPHRFLFDEDCGVCAKFALVLRNHARAPVELVPMHSVPADTGARGDLGEDAFWASAHFVRSDGREFHGGASVTRALRLLPGGFLAAVLDAPVMRIVRDRVYVIVARNRHHISRVLGLGDAGCSRLGGHILRGRRDSLQQAALVRHTQADRLRKWRRHALPVAASNSLRTPRPVQGYPRRPVHD